MTRPSGRCRRCGTKYGLHLIENGVVVCARHAWEMRREAAEADGRPYFGDAPAHVDLPKQFRRGDRSEGILAELTICRLARGTST